MILISITADVGKCHLQNCPTSVVIDMSLKVMDITRLVIPVVIYHGFLNKNCFQELLKLLLFSTEWCFIGIFNFRQF
jgi:hypothetical protein